MDVSRGLFYCSTQYKALSVASHAGKVLIVSEHLLVNLDFTQRLYIQPFNTEVLDP